MSTEIGMKWSSGPFFPPYAVKPLIAALKDEDRDVRCIAVKTLREIKDHRAVEPLIAALKDEDSYVSYNAAEALREIGDSREVEPLIAAMKGKPAKKS